MTDAQILQRIRRICASLPCSEEKLSFGHPAFAVGKRIYTVLEEYKGDLSLCILVGLDLQGVFLKDSRFYKTPYIGKKGWVSLKLHAAPLDWKEIEELINASYHQLTQPEFR